MPDQPIGRTAKPITPSVAGAVNSDPSQSISVGALLNAYGGHEGEIAATVMIPISIYLTDEDIHEHVETAVEQWLETADVFIDARDEPVIGSWFRRMLASLDRGIRTPAAREALLTATHIADSRLVQAQDAYVTATLLQNVGPVLQALQPTKDAVVRAGALLIVKIDWVVQVYQLTAAQQAILDHRPQLAASPREIITALQLPESDFQEAVTSAGPAPAGSNKAAGMSRTHDGGGQRP